MKPGGLIVKMTGSGVFVSCQIGPYNALYYRRVAAVALATLRYLMMLVDLRHWSNKWYYGAKLTTTLGTAEDHHGAAPEKPSLTAQRYEE